MTFLILAAANAWWGKGGKPARQNVMDVLLLGGSHCRFAAWLLLALVDWSDLVGVGDEVLTIGEKNEEESNSVKPSFTSSSMLSSTLTFSSPSF